MQRAGEGEDREMVGHVEAELLGRVVGEEVAEGSEGVVAAAVGVDGARGG